MRCRSQIVAILLAAGRSTRMGENKLLLKIGDKTVIEWTLDNILASDIDQTVVVLGEDFDKMTSAIGNRDVSIVHNKNYLQGMSTSLACGIEVLPSASAGAFILLADQPNLQTKTINRFLNAFKNSNKKIIAGKYHGVMGNPVLFVRELFPELLKISGDVGARSLLKRFPAEVAPVDIPTEQMLDIDTESDYVKVKSLLKSSEST